LNILLKQNKFICASLFFSKLKNNSFIALLLVRYLMLTFILLSDFFICFLENQSLIFSFTYDELIYHALSKQKNYVMIQLNLKEDFQSWIKKEDKIYLKCLNKEEGIYLFKKN